MRIAYISKYAGHPDYSRTRCRPYELLREFHRIGHDTTIVCSDSNHFAKFPVTGKIYNREKKEGVNFLWLKTKKYTQTTSIARILSWIDFEFKCFLRSRTLGLENDVIIVSSPSMISILYGLFLKKFFGVRLVWEIRDIWPLTLIEEGNFRSGSFVIRILSMIERLGLRYSDLIVGTMPRLDLHVHKIINHPRVFCSPLGFNLDDYTFSEPVSKKDPSQFHICYVGSIGITNALDGFFGAIKLLKSYGAIKFTVIGGGDLFEHYKEFVSTCPNVTFLGVINQNDILSMTQSCDLLYLSTHDSLIWDFGQSMNKVVEYMLCAKPIFASYSGYPSMISEAKCGWLESNRSPEYIAKRFVEISNLPPDELLRMGNRGRKWMVDNRQYKYLAELYLLELEEVFENAN